MEMRKSCLVSNFGSFCFVALFWFLLNSSHCQNAPGFSISISRTEFNEALTLNQFPEPSLLQYNGFIQGLPWGNISTKLEAAAALAQFTHESGGLRYLEETSCVNSTSPQCEYSSPNCSVAGKRYYGRGYIMISYCYNYRDASRDLGLGDFLVMNPEQVSRNETFAFNTAFSFWKRVVHLRPGVAQGRFGMTTRAINGADECTGESKGTERAVNRFKIYKNVFTAFGLPGQPDPRGCYPVDFSPSTSTIVTNPPVIIIVTPPPSETTPNSIVVVNAPPTSRTKHLLLTKADSNDL